MSVERAPTSTTPLVRSTAIGKVSKTVSSEAQPAEMAKATATATCRSTEASYSCPRGLCYGFEMLTPTRSRVEMTQVVMPTHTNGVGGILFGGVIMQWIDVCAGVAAMRHVGGPVVTASIDRLDFMSPIRVGDVVVLLAQVNYVHKTSMEVGCRVETEDMRTRDRRYTTKAYLTFVATDEQGRPRVAPPLVLETEDERRRHADAQARRSHRLHARQKGREQR
jgi:acyl-CoA hydrolase